jgi:hypothetical protein
MLGANASVHAKTARWLSVVLARLVNNTATLERLLRFFVWLFHRLKVA